MRDTREVGRLLEDGVVDPERLRATWTRTRSTLDSRDLRDARRYGVLAMACAAACVFVWWQGEGSRALELASGGWPEHVVAEAPTTVRFDDDSILRLGANAEVVPTRNVVGSFELAQPVGTVDYEVTPGGPRRWIVDAGLAHVEVVGTAFRVERSDAMVRVSVTRGRVRVGWRTSEGEQSVLLGAGDEQVVRAVTPARELDPLPELSLVEPPVARQELPVVDEPSEQPGPEVARSRSTTSWRDLAARGAHDAAYEALRNTREQGSLAQRVQASRDPDELMLLADTARLSGHAGEAIEPLERLSRDYPGDPRAPLAAIVLGRLQMQRGDREAALDAFARAESLGIPAALRDDVARRVASLRDAP